MKSQDTSELFFDDVTVPAANLLGGHEGQGFFQLMGDLPYERLIIGVTALACMEGAYEATLAYVRERKAFGKPIGDLQNTRFKLAEVATTIQVGRAFIDRCVEQAGGRQARHGNGQHGQAVGCRAAGQGAGRVPAAVWRLRLHERVHDHPHVCRRPGAAHLRRHQRDHEGSDFQGTVMSDQEQPLLIDERGGVAWLTMNRPARLNALNTGLTDALRSYFQGLEDRADIRVVVLRGAGHAYCAGLDLKDRTGAAPRDVQAGLAGQKAIRDIMIAMRECPQPIISIVEGPAAGGGLGIALASDIRLCTPEARFNAAFIKIGVSGCDMGSSYFLPRLLGASVAAEMLLTGRFLHADRAYALGFVSKVGSVAESRPRRRRWSTRCSTSRRWHCA